MMVEEDGLDDVEEGGAWVRGGLRDLRECWLMFDRSLMNGEEVIRERLGGMKEMGEEENGEGTRLFWFE